MQILENTLTAHILACALFVFFGLPASAFVSFSLPAIWWISITIAFVAVMHIERDLT